VETILTHATGTVLVEECGSGRRRVTVTTVTGNGFVSTREWQTAYPIDLVRHILDAKGTGWVCDEIRRDEDPDYVQRGLALALDAYLPGIDFAGRRVLDFGCGCGASTTILARLLSGAEIVGVELLDRSIAIARRRVEHYGYSRVELLRSPDSTQLPREVGEVDLAILSGVYEHLYPHERQALLAQIWASIREGGSLLVDRVPNRWSPFELHTTRLPLINYLPPALALAAARRLSARVGDGATWDELLRNGVRGATVREIVRLLPRAIGVPEVLVPSHPAVRDPIDLWYLGTDPQRRLPSLTAARLLMKAAYTLAGVSGVPYLTVAIRKRGEAGGE
jgi:2-polyprenyl-3-methyl-5-hydroxy-6-metoxy-1,4-benzoquinol methylase